VQSVAWGGWRLDFEITFMFYLRPMGNSCRLTCSPLCSVVDAICNFVQLCSARVWPGVCVNRWPRSSPRTIGARLYGSRSD
jgi:hypothetical protein